MAYAGRSSILGAVSKNRLEAFSDGVLAIAITLLVLELRPPDLEPGQTLVSALLHQWPSYVAYLVAFAQLGVIWLNHHRLFQQVKTVDGPALLLNLNLLLWVVVIPFPTSVVSRYLGDGGASARAAVTLFSLVLLATAISFVALYLWITHDARLIHHAAPPEVVRAARWRFSVGLGTYTLAIPVGLLVPWAALALHFAMALYYAFDQATLVRDDESAVAPS